jgi:acyl carrier protein
VLVSELGDWAVIDAAAPPLPTQQDAPAIGDAQPAVISVTSAISAITETPALSEDEIEDMILGEMAAGLGVSVDDIDPEEPFDSTDLDSAQAVVMMARLEAALGQKLSPTLVWNYPTPRKLAERLAGVSAEATRAVERASVT